MRCDGYSSGSSNERTMLAGPWDVKSPPSGSYSSSRAALALAAELHLSPSSHLRCSGSTPPQTLHISPAEAASSGAPYRTQADLLDRHSGRFLKK